MNGMGKQGVVSEKTSELGDIVLLTYESLNTGELIARIDNKGGSFGAISTFVGVTRSHFQGKKVVRLEYEAYDKMAIAELVKLCEMVRKEHEGVGRIVVAHRLGLVPAGENSVVIVVASPHRRDAIDGCGMAIEVLKERVPIWKREVYEDGSEWKQNSESCRGRSHKSQREQ